ncbi:hypothetical protein ABE493_07825 [Stenotrophomonas terrae]|uniref:hypothetical protein n=1 Tax=Stenotrophomonas terrae TaxID=405446 RepID=UPI0032089DC9
MTRFIVQLVTPALIGLVAFFGQMKLASIEDSQASMAKEQREQADRSGSMASDLRNLNTRFDLIAVRKLDELDKRVERLEQVTNTP